MKNYLFAALLGCFVTSGLAQSETFRFTDSQGRCWVCNPGAPCVPCPQTQPIAPPSHNIPLFPQALPPADHPPTCPVPNCADATRRPYLFPVNDDPARFWQCTQQGAGNWVAVMMECQCDAFFDYELQSCQNLWDWFPHCTITGPIPPPIPCTDEETTVPPAEETTVPPADTTVPPTDAPCVPCCMPCMIWWMCPPCGNNNCSNGCMG